MSVRRMIVLFLAMCGASLLVQMWLRFAGVNDHVRMAGGNFAIAMAAWVAEREWIQQRLLFGRSFATWFVATLTITAVVGWLVARFWPT
jgi:hypothetical protein